MKEDYFFNNIRTSKGRFSRSKFLLYFLGGIFIPIFINVIIRLAFFITDISINHLFEFILSAISVIFIFYILIITYIKRLHDLNKTGYLSLLIFIPFVNLIFLIYLLFVKGTELSNKYGEDIIIEELRIKKEKEKFNDFSKMENKVDEAMKNFDESDFNNEIIIK